MVARIFIALGLVVLGLAAYQGMLFVQRRSAANGSKRRTVSGRAALLVFTSPTCAPCKLQQLPVVNQLMVDWRDKMDLSIIDVTEQPDVAKQYGVWSLPTTIVVDAQQRVVAVNQGVAQAKKLREQFERATAAGTRTTASATQPVHKLAVDR
jgi:thioredoxin 1